MFILQLIEATYNFLWGDLFQIPLPVGGSIGISLLIIFLVPAAVYFTIRTRFMQLRLFPDMVRALTEQKSGENGLSPFQTLIVSTATRVGMGNLVDFAGLAVPSFTITFSDTAFLCTNNGFVTATIKIKAINRKNFFKLRL